MTSTTKTNVVQKDKAGLQELADPVADLDQGGVSLYTNSSQDTGNKLTGQVHNLDDSLCEDEGSNCVVPTKEDLTQVASDESILANNEKTENYSLVDELFDDTLIVSQSTTSSSDNVNFVNESFEKKIAPLFTSAKKKKWFQAPVQSVTNETACKADNEKSCIPADNAKTEKTKPVFTSGTKIKPSIGKKRKLSDANKGEDEKAPVKQKRSIEKSVLPDAETKETIKEGTDVSHKDSVDKVSSTTSGEITEKANKKKRQKKTTEDKENSAKKANSCKQPVGGKTVQSGDAKTKPEKAKSVFKKPGTKSSAEKKRNPSVAGKDVSEKDNEPQVKSVAECQPANIDGEVNFNVKETKEGTKLLSNDSVKKLSSTTDKDNSLLTEKVNKKKRKKKATEEDTGIKKMKKATGSTKEADASKKKTAQQQAKIEMSCKNLDREQRKAEKELQKISRELQKVRKQKDSKQKKVVGTSQQPSDSSSGSGQLWVQCDQPECLKWRRLRDCKNPSDIPEKWFCSMNPDQKFNSCTAPEEDSSDLSDSQEYVYAAYAPGALVWAKVTGYPWWPAMIQYDTNKDAFYEKHPSCHTPIAYHVVFFGKPVSRAWVHSLCLQAFLPDDEDPNTKVAQKYNNPLAMAMKQADEASQVSVEERLAKYSFDKLYTGKSMYIDDQWASGKETKKRKFGAPKKTQDVKS